ncbi:MULTISPECIES: hypothetical protein [unclassified Motilimonas]|nr:MULTISPECIES: hypothetical protein [unclassified Motilimonas]MDO6526155.1 hypothetical protein [Motilimonas sp. 1_MG-2023]
MTEAIMQVAPKLNETLRKSNVSNVVLALKQKAIQKPVKDIC